MYKRANFETQARQLLARASILSEAGAGTLGISRGGNDDSDGRPSGNAHDLYGWLLDEFNRCRSLRDFEGFCVMAEREIRGICKSRPAPVVKEETAMEFQARIIREGEGESLEIVAMALRTTPTIVARARKATGRDLERGKPLPRIRGLPASERRERAAELRSKRMTLDQIAYELGCDSATISRDLRRAA